MYDRDNNSLNESLDFLRGMISHWTGRNILVETPIPGLMFYQHDSPSRPHSAMYEPSICIIVQGSKRALLGGKTYEYDAHHYLVASVHLPTVVQILEASPEKPCMGMVLNLDKRKITELMVDSHLPKPRTRKSTRSLAIGDVTLPLLNAFERLVALLDHPRDIPILSRIITEEILYRLLVGDQGERLRQIATTESQSHRIARAIDWLKVNYSKPFNVDELATRARMSISTFNHHFRSMTALSPLQFQKQLRLQEARRLMLAENIDVANAAFQVGYESPSQFSREYSRQFGLPPLRDIKNLQNTGLEKRI